MKTIRDRRPEIQLRFNDPTISPAVGLMLVGELDRCLGISQTLDAHIGPIKARRQGASSGELVLALAESMLAGGDFLCDLDHLRADQASAELRAVCATPASTTAIGLAKRFGPAHLAGIEAGVAACARRAFDLLPRKARRRLRRERPTIDLDPTDVEVYGTKKEGVAFNYAGQWCGRPQPAVWAEAGWVLAAELTSGICDPRPRAPSLIARAVGALPAGLGRPRIRADAGFFDQGVARAALEAGADFGVAAKRNPAVWRAVRRVPKTAWRKARGMPGAQVAEASYVPAGWPAGTRAIVRRVRLGAAAISADPRSRRRRTIDPAQLRMVLGGEADHAHAYSVILTNLPGEPRAIEAWYRGRAQVEERIRDSRLGMALRHLPSGYQAVNAVWMWAALTALNCSAWMQALSGLDAGGRAHGKRLRRELICIPGRVIHHARQIIVRLSPSQRDGPILQAYRALRALPSPNG